jgi:SsrA-binding protein
MSASPKSPAGGRATVATHRKARRDYHVVDTLEAGVELRGTEVKSVRQGNIALTEGYARLEKNGEVLLYGVHINPYDHGNVHNHDPVRPRRLLLHQHEIKRLFGLTAVKGYALIPLRAYFRRGRLKVELGLCKGKQTVDKREDLKRKTADREAQRAMAASRR